MKAAILSIIFALSVFSGAHSQSVQPLNRTGSTEILLDNVKNTFGPSDNFAVGFAWHDMLDSITLKGYPTLKNLPDSLRHLKVYTYMLDDKQLYYQNYRNGIYSKAFFTDYFKKQKFDLRDTLSLTPTMLKCYFSYAVGFDRNKKARYVIDTNGNNDFADEKLMESQDEHTAAFVDSAINVSTESFDGKNIVRETVRCALILRPNNPLTDIDAMVSIPQFRYAKISYEGTEYYVCTDYSSRDKNVYICKVQPYFRRLSHDLQIKPNQIVVIGNTYFKYERTSQNPYKIKLTSGFNEADRKTANAKPDIQTPSRQPVAERVGMTAPDIKGINILNGTTLSLNALRGKYVFLDFWATWCGPCVAEFPNIRKVYDTFSSDQFVILGVCEDDRNGKIKAFLKDQDVIWPTIIKTASTTKTEGYNISSFPTSFLIDPDGKIITTNLRNGDLFMWLENLKMKKK